MNLFTFNFRELRKHLVSSPGMWAALAILIAEGMLHVCFSLNLKNPREGDFRADAIEAAINQAESSHPAEIAIVGSSISKVVDAAPVNQKLKGHKIPYRAYNYPLYSSNPEGVTKLTKDVILDNYTPKMFIYALSSRDIDSSGEIPAINSNIPDIQSYRASRFEYRLGRLLWKNLYLLRYRQRLRKPIQFVRDMFDTPLNEQASESLPPARRVFESLTFEDKTLRDLTNWIQDVQRSGSTPAVMLVPVNPALEMTSDLFRDQQEEAFQRIEEELSRLGVDLIPFPEELDSKDYYEESHHLSTAGSTIASETVFHYLSTLFSSSVVEDK